MKTKLSIIIAGLLLFCFGQTFALKEARFMQYPDIHKNTIIFTYQGDLWQVDIAGGIANRLTSSPGNEYSAKYSPDGLWIAFTGTYDGSTNAYVIPSDGGEPKRITYLPGSVQTVSWTPDSKRVVVRSYYENYIGRDPNLYFVDKEGSAPTRFPIDRGRLCSFSKDGTKILYQRRGDEEYNRKRYHGGQYPDIWMYDFTANSFSQITTYVGKNVYPMWIGNAMYFVSDQTNTVSNIHKCDLATKSVSPVTTFDDVDVIMPSTDGENIVFLHDGYIYLYNIASGSEKKITIQVATDDWATRTKIINPKDYIHWMNVSNDGKTVVMEARGDVFAGPTEKGSFKNISKTPGTREMYPQISPDGKWIAFFSDKSGEYQLYMQPVDGGEWVPLTTKLDRTNYHPLWSPDGEKILFGNKDFSIFCLDVDTKKIITVDQSNQMKNDEFYWEVSDYNWSPDSKWICYSLVQYNRNNQVFIYNIESGKRYPVTDDFYDNLNPCFDANGEYLYYLSSRNFDVQMDFYEDDHVLSSPQNIMVVQLKENERPPFVDTSSSVKPKAGPFRIDLNGLKKRTYAIPGLFGNYFFLKAGKGKVLWSSVDHFTEAEYEEIFKPGPATKWQLHIYSMDERKENVLTDKIRDFQMSVNGENMILQSGSDYYTTTPEKAYQSKSVGNKLSFNGMLYTVNYRQEWLQIFNDAWRWYREFFYDQNMVGKDWNLLGEKYRAYVAQINSRDDLNWVMLQLVGELATSHTYISGGDGGPNTVTPSPVYTGWLGADLVPDETGGYYKFQTIYGPTEYNENIVAPLSRPDVKVKEGDYLIAIDGERIVPPEDYNKHLQITAGQKIQLTVNSTPSATGARTYEIEPMRNDPSLRYVHWLTSNIDKVLKQSDNKVGYMHINAMGSGGIGEFDKFWRAFRYKDALIIDVRRNGGGWTEYFMIDKLERQMVAQNVLRNMVPFRYPGSTSTGNYVVISNENNGSDGEAFIEHFKARKLGTVVGVPSWGGLVGILNTQRTIDNGSVEQSNNAFYNVEGKWLVENHGADPDIVIDNDPASVMAGKDPQLDKAIEAALQKVKDKPFNFPPVPQYPKR
jgi:tricorn protease